MHNSEIEANASRAGSGWVELNFSNEVKKLQPVVSVVVVTYQQVKFIDQCLNSIVNQRTNFPFEIIIGEDLSTDGTREKCIEFAKKQCDKCRLILHDRSNQVVIEELVTGMFNFLHTICQARGRYIAICEGDDYWTDPEKLQKQFKYMEANPDVFLCHTEYNQLNDLTGAVTPRIVAKEQSGNVRKKMDLGEIIRFNKAKTATFFWRNVEMEQFANIISKESFVCGDAPLLYFSTKLGKISFLDDTTACYRKTPNSATSPTSFENAKRRVLNGPFRARMYFLKNIKSSDRKIIAYTNSQLNFHLFIFAAASNRFALMARHLIATIWWQPSMTKKVLKQLKMQLVKQLRLTQLLKKQHKASNTL